MSILSPPPALKNVLRYLRISEPIRQREPLVAYICHMYALEQAFQVMKTDKTPEIRAYITTLMDFVEKEKSQEAITQVQDKKAYYNDFCLKVFNHAYEEDSLGLSSKDTAETYYHASVYFDAMKHFGDVESKFQEMHSFCVWRSSEIMKAIKEGRAPAPIENNDLGGVDEDVSAPDTSMNSNQQDLLNFPDVPDKAPTNGHSIDLDTMDIPTKPNFGESPIPSFPNVPSSVDNREPPVHVHIPEPKKEPVVKKEMAPPKKEIAPPKKEVPTNVVSNPNNSSRKLIKANIPEKKSKSLQPKMVHNSSSSSSLSSEDQDAIVEATKYAKFAVSALLFDDKATAIINLKKALGILTFDEDEESL